MQWETVIGLEIHTQLSTKSKIFSGSSTAFGAEPNTQANSVDLGLPGTLPVLNREVVRMAIKFGLATGSQIALRSVFARKNYFYPDLPKGYQISQFELPIVGAGSLEIELENGETKSIGITRAHLEEDAGKSLHEGIRGMTGIDLNRAGTPLLEIVSEPELSSAKEAVAYAKKIHSLVRYLDICDGNMQEGSLRCDANVSIRLRGDKNLGVRTETKNVNSFRFLEKAINFEIERQIDVLESGGVVMQETRLYDADKNETRPMRSKEEANDYRYFPDPDLLPVELDAGLIEQLREQLPELPDAKIIRYMQEFELSKQDAQTLASDRDVAFYFEAAVAASSARPKLVANWVSSDLAGKLHKSGLGITDCPVSAKQLAGLIDKISDDTISGKIAKQVFDAIWLGEGDADAIIESRGLEQITDTGEIDTMIDQIIAANPGQVEQYRAGKVKLLGYFVGQVMKASGGKANPAQLNQLLKSKLDA
jgi:aspartyl-tRNA(Asn)/glutamyl-tRNA(Gln) amidotransferase subunit B